MKTISSSLLGICLFQLSLLAMDLSIVALVHWPNRLQRLVFHCLLPFRSSCVPPLPTDEEKRCDEFYRSPQWPDDPLSFMSSRRPGFFCEKLTVGQIKVAKQESDLYSIAPNFWYRCGVMSSEMLQLNQPRSEQPPFGTSIADLLEENISVNSQGPPDCHFTDDDIKSVRYGVRVALECLTLGSPHMRRDLFRVDPRLSKRSSEAHCTGWSALAGIENVKPKGRPSQPMDFSMCLFLLTSFRRIFRSPRSQQVASVMLGFDYPASSYNCSILTAADFLSLMKKVQILPTGFREVMTLTTHLHGRPTGCIHASVLPQRGGCDPEREIMLTRSLFPDLPETSTPEYNLSREVLLAVEKSKTDRMATRNRKVVQAQEQELRDLEEIEEPEVQIPETITEAWEQDFFNFLTGSFAKYGLSTVSIAYLLQQYGPYFIEMRSRLGHNPPLEMLEMIIKLLPPGTLTDNILSNSSDPSSETTNWLTRYQIRLPSCLTRDDLSVYCSQQFFYNQVYDAEVPSVVYDEVFPYSDPELSTSTAGLLDQGMIVSSVDSSELPTDEISDQSPYAFARSSLSLTDLQRLRDRILLNPLLTPGQFEDNFTSGPFYSSESSRSADYMFTLPNYLVFFLAGPPSDAVWPPVTNGFEDRLPTHGPEGAIPTFDLLSYPRPLIVQDYRITGLGVDKRGKPMEFKSPVCGPAPLSYRNFLTSPARPNMPYRFARGTLHKILCRLLRPSEDYGVILSDDARTTVLTADQLYEASVYKELRPAFGKVRQFPSIAGRSFDPVVDYAGQYTVVATLTPMLEPTLIPPQVVRPAVGVAAHMDTHSLYPMESLFLYREVLAVGYQVLDCYTKDDVRYFRSEWSGLPVYQNVISPGKLDFGDQTAAAKHAAQGYTSWPAKKGGRLISGLVGGCGYRLPITAGTPAMFEEERAYQAIVARRKITYVYHHPDGAPSPCKLRDPSVPQETTRSLWHRVKNTTTNESYWEKLVWEGFPGCEVHNANYHVKGRDTGSRIYISWVEDIERETVWDRFF
ncbi:unnamed protein product [Oikopleura dioica]|uniref:Uncharacterized protein n=1 Tax=Oikopleura dioica TaxID=34765 RepID=E4Y5F0_OIKDI|nr:unnamed protein product [Oikopleura dioica]